MRSKDSTLMEQIKNYVNTYRSHEGKTPKIRDIAAELHIGKTTVQRYLHEMAERGILKYDGKAVHAENTYNFGDEFCNVPVVGSIPCGNPIEEEENVEGFYSLPRALVGQGNFYILHASGDSMIDAHIDNGDLVIIRKQEVAGNGDIVAALVDGKDSTLKRFCIDEEGKPYLHPENDEYEDIYPEMNLQIQGVAIQVIKKL